MSTEADIRRRYESWNKTRLIEHAISTHRDQTADQKHRAAIKRDLERAEALQAASLTELDAKLGGPYIRELLLAIHDVLEAGDPLSSAPSEQTMRGNRPDSTADEGAPTRRYRNMTKAVRRRIDRLTESLRSDLERDESLSDVRSFAAHERWHKESPNPDCQFCAPE